MGFLHRFSDGNEAGNVAIRNVSVLIEKQIEEQMTMKLDSQADAFKGKHGGSNQERKVFGIEKRNVGHSLFRNRRDFVGPNVNY